MDAAAEEAGAGHAGTLAAADDAGATDDEALTKEAVSLLLLLASETVILVLPLDWKSSTLTIWYVAFMLGSNGSPKLLYMSSWFFVVIVPELLFSALTDQYRIYPFPRSTQQIV